MSDQLYNWLEELLPEIPKHNSEEEALLKFAVDKNISPGWFGKLARTYNVLKTNHYLNEANNRGGTFGIVDPVALTTKYATMIPEADNKSSASYDDDFDAYETVKSFPDIFSSEADFNITFKAASAPKPEAHLKTIKELKKEASIAQINLDNLKTAEFYLQEETRRLCEEITDFYKYAGTDFSKLEADALLRAEDVEATKKVIDLVVKYSFSKNLTLKRASGPGRRRLIRDEDGQLKKLDSLHENLDCIKIAQAQIPEREKEIEALRNQVWEDIVKEAVIHTEEARKNRSEEEKTTIEPKTPNKGRGEGSGPSTDSPPKPIKPKSQDKNTSKTTDLTDDFLAGFGTVGSPSWGGKLANPLEVVQKMFMQGAPGMNAQQMEIDSGYEDAEIQSNVQRLLSHDPVISRAEDSMVEQMVNSIIRTAPEAARDPFLLKFMLREMLAMGGIDSAGYKDMQKIHGDGIKNLTEQDRLNRSRYAINQKD